LRHQLILTAVAVLLASSPALAELECPSLNREIRMQALETRIESLQTRLDSLDTRVQSFEVDRRRILDEAKASIEAVAHDTSRSRTSMDAAVKIAIARADIKAKVAAASASATHAEMKVLKGQIDSLLAQLHKLARASGSPRAEG
jgi:hypothetical protein